MLVGWDRVDFDPSCLFSMSKDGCRKITAITCYERNTERGCNAKSPKHYVFLFQFQYPERKTVAVQVE